MGQVDQRTQHQSGVSSWRSGPVRPDHTIEKPRALTLEKGIVADEERAGSQLGEGAEGPIDLVL
jgi:hypothetical protein